MTKRGWWKRLPLGQYEQVSTKGFSETDKKDDKIRKEAEALKIHKMSPTEYFPMVQKYKFWIYYRIYQT